MSIVILIFEVFRERWTQEWNFRIIVRLIYCGQNKGTPIVWNVNLPQRLPEISEPQLSVGWEQCSRQSAEIIRTSKLQFTAPHRIELYTGGFKLIALHLQMVPAGSSAVIVEATRIPNKFIENGSGKSKRWQQPFGSVGIDDGGIVKLAEECSGV